ncbi:protein WVD2-like 7 isoform X1 [Tripterygium wilfordii]|uniref:protein WVD2-like 7 isoform X1 n=1 Tax=Tripterygium wilfordii TaxID=458696 RepID=UPI0018F84782|nr:protein WVD2-like 7 isoform X1 [Tripterygium wilfordii]XP_038694048.1 protein WVD2-like 7 isoform X1 [Tripterygium wilfordii]XP_038694049.1 protein WVD2-like 7 isoform X1 [Tripterygium wilfordii]
MGETAKSNPVLEVSVSFGRFENDALSWEKFSSFSPNKYLEEVEKCATPGSVAQKKAYFEAHYKKIAARKAELMNQEKQMENDALSSDHDHDHQNGRDLVGNNGGIALGYHLGDIKSSAEAGNEEVKPDNDRSNTPVDKPKEDNEVNVECQSSSVQEVKEDLDSVPDSLELSKPEDIIFRKESEEVPSTGSQGNKELSQQLGDELETAIKINEQNKKLDNLKESQKVTPISKDRNMTVLKKKTASPLAKAPQDSTHRKATKAAQISTPKALAKTSQILAPKVSAREPKILTPKVSGRAPQFSTPRVSTKSPYMSTPKMTKPKTSSTAMSASSKNCQVGESKKMTSKSLHVSLSFDPLNSGPALGTTARKSYIMEKMGDKDIVKRAFKTFQSNFNQLKSSSEEISSGAKQMPVKGAAQKVYTPTIPRKDIEGSLKAGGLAKRTTEAASSSYGLGTDQRVEKQREFFKKFERESNPNKARNAHIQTKSKEEKASEIKMPRQNLNFRATATSGFYLGQKTSKISLDKEGSKTLGL